MLVYRISQTRYAHQLFAPGIEARWNSGGRRVIYTAGSLALACLEVLAHKSGASLASGNFSVAVIRIADSLKIEKVTADKLTQLNENWYSTDHYPLTQEIGNTWLARAQSPVLKVPSSIIDLEYNYLINPGHPDFAKIKIVKVSKFTFDPRLKPEP